MTKRIDGKARADRLIADVAAATAKLKSPTGIALAAAVGAAGVYAFDR